MAINALTIPTSAMPVSSSYSGMGQGWQNFSQQQQPILSKLLSSFGNFSQPYGQAANSTTQYMNSQLMPSIQGVLNKLTARGVLNSSVASDALSKTATGLGGEALGAQASQMGNAASQYAPALFSGAQLGQYSTSSSKDASAPYRIMAQLLSGMM